MHHTLSLCAGSNVSLYVTVDPCRPYSLPQLKFLGPEHGMYIRVRVFCIYFSGRNLVFVDVVKGVLAYWYQQ